MYWCFWVFYFFLIFFLSEICFPNTKRKFWSFENKERPHFKASAIWTFSRRNYLFLFNLIMSIIVPLTEYWEEMQIAQLFSLIHVSFSVD